MEKIRTLIVDDEEPGRTRVLELLKRDDDIQVVGIASDGREAVSAINDSSVDIVFLDVQMPLLDGFGVLRRIPPNRAPIPIFVTAFDSFAIRAFEAHALDYLLKPFSDERFEDALTHAKNQVKSHATGNVQLHLARFLEESANEKSHLDRIILRNNGRITFLNVTDIDWIEAEGVYIYLHMGQKKLLYRATLGQMHQKLDPQRFVRISRSVTVNVDRIRELQQHTNGNYIVVLRDGIELSLTKGYRSDIENWLKQSL
jgi:two-component system LytT family response regulator